VKADAVPGPGWRQDHAWRAINAVFPDELHDDAPLTLAAIRELRAAARPFPDVPVVDGTDIPRDRPDAVAGAILAVAAQARPLA
jgi:hypothetical protein